MEKPTTIVVISLVAIILLLVLSIMLLNYINSASRTVNIQGHKISASAEIIGNTVSGNMIIKVSFSGNFSADKKLVIDLPTVAKNSNVLKRVVKIYGVPMFDVYIVPIPDIETGLTKPVVFANLIDNSGSVYDSTVGNESTMIKNGVWISFVEFVAKTDRGNNVGVTMLSGCVCAKYKGKELCFFRVVLLFHDPSTILINKINPSEEIGDDFPLPPDPRIPEIS